MPSGDMCDDESSLLSPLCFLESPEPYIPLLDCLPNPTVETENSYNDPFGLIPISTRDETNCLLSSQQSNLITYQETSTLVPNPLEMHQHQHQQHLQHQNQNQYQHQHQHQVVQQQRHQLSNSHETWLQDNLSNMLNTIHESSVFTGNQTEIGQQVRQENNGFAHPTVTNSPIQLQNRFLPVPLIPQGRSNAFGSLFPHANSSNRSQNYMPYQTPHQHVASSFGMYPHQPPPPVFASRQNVPPNLRMVNNLAMMRTHPLHNQTNMIPTFNAVPQRNIPSTIPRPQMSSRFIRQHGGMQTSVNQSPWRFRLPNINNRQMPIRPNANAIIPPQGEILGCRRRSYPTRFEFGQSSSSSVQRRVHRIVSEGENLGSTGINHPERRHVNNIYNPRYESLGLYIDPHLRKYSLMT